MTADGRGGPRDRSRPPGLTRRRLLAGLGGVGAIGMASGAGTFAHFSDAETFANNAFGAGEVDIELSFKGSCDGCVASDDGRASFAFDDIDRGDSGRIVLLVDVQTNPARLWLGTQCPPVSGSLDLGEEIKATLTVGDFSRSGSLFDLRREFGGGLRLDDRDGDACLDPADGPIEVALHWNLPDEAPDDVAGASTLFDVQFGAEQCRHVSEAAASNPFAGLDCDDVERPSCAVCADNNGTKIGSLTFRYLGTERADVVAAATGGGADGVGQGGTVVFDATVAPGERFTVDAGPADVAGDDGNWIGPNLYVDDGSGPSSPGNSDKPDGVTIHTSCSEPLKPGTKFDGKFELVSGTTVDGEPLCDDAVKDPEEPDNPEEPEEPENPAGCVVCEDREDSEDENVELEALTFRYEGSDPATLEVTSLKGNTDGVLFTGNVSNGDEFTVNADDVSRKGEPTGKLGPEIRIDRDDGEEQTDVHVSCSKLLAVGMAFGDGGKYVAVDGTTTDGQRICAEEDL